MICDNGDDIPDITANVFLLPKLQSPAFLKCDQDIPKIELGLWAECCQGWFKIFHFYHIFIAQKITIKPIFLFYSSIK